ncbi:MAG: GAF domain-containing protein [Clostridia bacterium]|nr:MAG: GAF domain-containing protein [Clostridia bacterium]
MTSGQPAMIYDLTTDLRSKYPEAAQRLGLCSMACVPVISNVQIVGVLDVFTHQPHEFETDELQFLQELAAHAGVAIHNSRQMEALCQANTKLEEMGRTDCLTGLYNRQHFDTLLEHHISQARRHGYQLSVLTSPFNRGIC